MRIRDWSSDVCSSDLATQYAVSAGALYTISKSDTLDVTLRNGRYSQERVSPDSPTQASRPIRFTLSGGTATYTHVFNRLRVRGVIDVENRNYGDSVTPDGTPIDQDFRDHTTYTEIGRASCREECVNTGRSRWSQYH